MSESPTDPLALWTRRRRAIAIASLAVLATAAGIIVTPSMLSKSKEPALRNTVRTAIASAHSVTSSPVDAGGGAAPVSRVATPAIFPNLEAFATNLWRTSIAPPAMTSEPITARTEPSPEPPAITLVALLGVQSDRPRVAVTIAGSPRVYLLTIGDTLADAIVIGIDAAGMEVEHVGESYRLDLPRRTPAWPASLERVAGR